MPLLLSFLLLPRPHQLTPLSPFSSAPCTLVVTYPCSSSIPCTLESELAESKRNLKDAKQQESEAREAATALRATVETTRGLISM